MAANKNSPATYLIPTIKTNEITTFIGATITSSGEVFFEMHRKSSQVSKAREYSYANISLMKSKIILDHFQGKPPQTGMARTATDSNGLVPLFCWWDYREVSCQQFTDEGTQPSNLAAPVRCYAWYEICIPIGDDGGTPGGGGGGGGGGTPPPPNGPCALQGTWYGLLPPYNPCDPPPIPPEDTMSILTRLRLYSEAIRDTANAVFQRSMNQQHEWCFIIVKKGNSIYAMNVRTDHLPNNVDNNWLLQPGESLLGASHTHQDTSQKLTNRPGPSDGDIIHLNSQGHQTKQNLLSL